MRKKVDREQSSNVILKNSNELSKKLIEEISYNKGEPLWMKELRLKSLDIFLNKPNPNFGVDLSKLDINEIIPYLKPNAEKSRSWDDVPENIKETFEKLGIPEAERKVLSGVGAQYDSEIVYQNIKEHLSKLGVIFLDMESAVREYPQLVKKYFMQAVPPTDHKFAALHGAVWSGGSFVYVPENVEVPMPLQAYFMMASPGIGQFEHTLIILERGAKLHFIEGCSAPKYSVSNLHSGMVEIFVGEGATMRYSTIQNWSKNTYNLNTKRALVNKDATMIWVSGSIGSSKTMLYPTSILKGNGARAEHLNITYAGREQHLDTGSKVIHLAPYTSSKIDARSISSNGGWSFYRGLLKVSQDALHVKSSVECSALMLDGESASDTLPIMEIMNNEADVGHEARVGRIKEEQIYYLMSRGLNENDAKAMIVRGFMAPIVKQLPLEYAIEFNRLVSMNFESSLG
ncbi:Fe-S cluster assembly protein SufB [Mesoaciditoga lauensis]|uniref:Fe-S cluster assembly protein SufB n=1 Tax=Mesoaciditoga lauensis TaxID=1495039 RepID=UPI00068A0A5B|nr:Fe-S cluster assembly protein SufB [Mesoaciditoga lauensis]